MVHINWFEFDMFDGAIGSLTGYVISVRTARVGFILSHAYSWRKILQMFAITKYALPYMSKGDS